MCILSQAESLGKHPQGLSIAQNCRWFFPSLRGNSFGNGMADGGWRMADDLRLTPETEVRRPRRSGHVNRDVGAMRPRMT